MRIVYNEEDIKYKLPILGQTKYLKAKSHVYGWFTDDVHVLPFFLDKRVFFTRMVFTTEVILKNNLYISSNEGDFLDSVVAYIKKNKICDFVYKAQSNVVFNICPKDAICVPWGTYEVDIKKADEELFNSFNGKCRNAIRKAKKEGVTVENTENIKLVYNNIKETLKRQKSIHYPSYEYIEALKRNLPENIIFLISVKNFILQGSLILIYDHSKGYAMYAGSIKSPQTGSLDLLHYEAMRYLKSKNIAIYDFVGTRLNIKKGSKQEGIDKFKKKFNPKLRKGCAFVFIVNSYKYYMYILFSKIYLKFKGYKYSDPVLEIRNQTKES